MKTSHSNRANPLDENEIIIAVCAHLERMRLAVRQRLHTTQDGVDIIAVDPISGQMHYIEAKGGTSSHDGSARFGKKYTQSQVFDRVAKGVFTALELRAAHPNRESEVISLAVPDTEHFRRYLTGVAPQLTAAGLQLLLVSTDHSVVAL